MKPPESIAAARVLAYASVSSCDFQGSNLFVDGVALGPVPRLAIAEDLQSGTTLLLRCGLDWSVLGLSGHPSAAAARSRAEREYRGSSSLWRETGYSDEEARAARETSWGETRCSICGRTPDHYAALVKSPSGTSLCDQCLNDLDTAR
ncbi:MAG: hypothetical protein DWQ36_13795 [Acidobacteria bacterium]|nr:MAG: hypothetical protein DWQ30_20160 [Acidobacteriota bacterium]REK06281.1 MAG: hypothetical protein DWQ36_13795 [Acidobacteriota bacterium]